MVEWNPVCQEIKLHFNFRFYQNIFLDLTGPNTSEQQNEDQTNDQDNQKEEEEQREQDEQEENINLSESQEPLFSCEPFRPSKKPRLRRLLSWTSDQDSFSDLNSSQSESQVSSSQENPKSVGSQSS